MPSVLTTADVQALEAAADNLRDLLMCRLFCLYGPRRSELLALDAQDVHLAEERLRLPVRKREKGAWRWVPLDARTRDLLEEYIRRSRLKPHDRLFRISPSHCTHVIRGLADRAGLKPITPPDGSRRRQWLVSPHRLRDFSVTSRLTDPALREKGLEGLKAVAEFHGHKDPRSTLRYLRLTEGWREEVFHAGMEELLVADTAGDQPPSTEVQCNGRCHRASPHRAVYCFCFCDCYSKRPHGSGGR